MEHRNKEPEKIKQNQTKTLGGLVREKFVSDIIPR